MLHSHQLAVNIGCVGALALHLLERSSLHHLGAAASRKIIERISESFD
jgi:hypothetical protein